MDTMDYRPMRRANRALDEPAIEEILQNGEYGVLATVNAYGSPYCIPLNYVADAGVLYMHCATEGHKLDNIRRDSRVCFTVISSSQVLPEQLTAVYESAVVFGKAEIIEDPDAKTEALLLLCRKYSPGHMDKARGSISRALKRTAIIKITVQHATGKAKQNKR